MKIGIDARRLGTTKPAGVGVYLREIISYMNEVDHHNEFYLYTNKPFEQEYAFGSNFHIKVIPGKIGTIGVRFFWGNVLKRDGIDVFWGPEHVLPKKIKGIRYVITIHDLALLINPKWGRRYNAFIQNSFLKPSVKDAEQVIAISNCTKNDVVSLCNVRSDLIRVIYNGGAGGTVDRDDFRVINDVRKKHEIDKKYFLYVGTIEPRKNIETIVKAFEIIYQVRQDILLILAGGLGWRYKTILELIEKSPANANIRMLGYVSQKEKAGLFLGADAFVFPSHYEGFGVPVIESMSYGVPVVTTRKSSLEEIGGDVAFYVEDENNVELVAEKMNMCLDLSSEEKTILEARLIERSQLFTWERCAQETYKYILNNGLEDI